MTPGLETLVGLFPGHGGYRRGALHDQWSARDAIVRDVFAAIDATARVLLHKDVSSRVFCAAPPTPEELFAEGPVRLQLATFGVSVATYRLLVARGVQLSLLVGHGPGEVAALVCGGALAVQDGAEVICHRLAASAAPGAPSGGMVSLACSADRAQQLLDLIARPDLAVAAVDAPGQVVVAGSHDGLRTVEHVAAAVGIGGARLLAPAPGPNPVPMPAYLQRPLALPVYSPILGRGYRDQDDVVALLGQHLAAPVRFGAAIERLHGAGARIFVEVGAGRALTTLARAAFPDIAALTPGLGHGDLDATAAFLRGSTAVATRLPVDGTVRKLCAEVLRYPEEVLTPGAHLEADLGIDSVKRTELLGLLSDHFGLGEPPEGFRPSRYETFGAVVELMSRSVRDGHLVV